MFFACVCELQVTPVYCRFYQSFTFYLVYILYFGLYTYLLDDVLKEFRTIISGTIFTVLCRFYLSVCSDLRHFMIL